MNVLLTGAGGYIGSALARYLAAEGHDVTGIDIRASDEALPYRYINDSYNNLAPRDLARFDAIVHLAAHSSVKQCREYPYRSVVNNLFSFFEMIATLPPSTRLLYASTGSLYSEGIGGQDAQFQNIYDFTKYAGDGLTQLMRPGVSCAMRFGTVAGLSPVMRWDTVVNAMAQSACREGHVKLFNPETMRPILGIKDLCRAVDLLLRKEGSLPPIVKLASFSAKIRQIAVRMSDHFGVPLQRAGWTAGYDFDFVPDNEPRETLDSIIADLAQRLGWEKAA